MKLGVVVDGGPSFIGELLDDWRAHFETKVFSHRDIRLPLSQGRVNRWRLHYALGMFLRDNNAVFFEWAGPLLIVASRLSLKAKIIVRLHSFELYDFAPHINWQAIDRIVLVSEAMRRRFCDLYPDAAGKTHVVFYGKPLDRFCFRERPFSGVLGMLGALVPIKRVYEVILALYELNRGGIHFTLRLGGMPGQGADAERYAAALRRLVCQLKLQNQVHFDGHIADPAEYLSRLDVFISNSYWEGQQNALLEAMASGCYCLSHHWDGADEVLPSENLFVTDQELRERIVQYCALPSERKRDLRMSMRAIAEEKFDIQRNAPLMRQVIQSAAGA